MEKNKGFSLIEIIVILGIIGILTGFTFSSYNYFTAKKQLDSDVRRFTSILELAREKAAAGDISFCQTKNLNVSIISYEIEIQNNTTYVLRANCINSTNISKTYNLEKSKFSVGVGTTVRFAAQTGKNLSQNCQCFRITENSRGFTSKFICVKEYGNIELQDTNC